MLQKIIDYLAKLFGIKREVDTEKKKRNPSDDIYPLY